MATYQVSLDMSVPPELDAKALDRLLLEVIRTAACRPLEVTPTSLLIEADRLAIEMLESVLCQAIVARGGRLHDISITRR